MFLAHCLCIMLVPSLMWAQSPVRDSAGVTMVRTVPVATTPVVVSRQASRVITVGADVDVVGALRMSDGTIWIADAAARKLARRRGERERGEGTKDRDAGLNFAASAACR